MPICIYKEKKLLFVHVPKTGGTSINSFLEEHTSTLLRFGGTPPALKCPPQHLEAGSLRAIVPHTSFDGIFSVVRHPEDRLISEFRSRYLKSRYRNFIESVSHSRTRDLLRSSYFSKWALKSMHRCKSDPFFLSNHVRPQNHFILCDDHRIFKLEDGVDGALDFIRATLRLIVKSKPIEHLNSSSTNPILVPQFVRGKIETFYAEDFEKFGYERRS